VVESSAAMKGPCIDTRQLQPLANGAGGGHLENPTIGF